MTPCVEQHDTELDYDAPRYEIVYVTKRPGYEFVFAVPTTPTGGAGKASARFQLRFRGSHREREVVLDLQALEDFYESLSRLIDYVRIEREKPSQL
jgi:hypothetical protein